MLACAHQHNVYLGTRRSKQESSKVLALISRLSPDPSGGETTGKLFSALVSSRRTFRDPVSGKFRCRFRMIPQP